MACTHSPAEITPLEQSKHVFIHGKVSCDFEVPFEYDVTVLGIVDSVIQEIAVADSAGIYELSLNLPLAQSTYEVAFYAGDDFAGEFYSDSKGTISHINKFTYTAADHILNCHLVPTAHLNVRAFHNNLLVKYDYVLIRTANHFTNDQRSYLYSNIYRDSKEFALKCIGGYKDTLLIEYFMGDLNKHYSLKQPVQRFSHFVEVIPWSSKNITIYY